MRAIATILGLSLLLGCNGGCRDTSALKGRLEAKVSAGATTFDFAAESPFAWDRMFVFGPYTNRRTVEKSIGFEWPDYARTSIGSSDSVCLVVFVQNREVVHWYEQPRAVGLGWLANVQGYSRSNAQFRIERSAGRVELKPLDSNDKPAVGG